MTAATLTNEPAKRPRKPIGNEALFTSFEIEPDAVWMRSCLVATMPPAWRDRLAAEYRKNTWVQEGWSLPTRGLVEILIAVDPAVIHADWDLASETFLVAFDGVDPHILTAAVAAWASTEVRPDVNWFDELDSRELIFTPAEFDVLQHQVRHNRTAAPAAHVYKMLPTFVALHVIEQGLTLLDEPRRLILGPPQRNNRRDIVLWPPQPLETDATGEALVTAKITIHVETAPNQPGPRVYADLSISRFPLRPVTYVPSRGDGPPGATLWLHGPEGFLRQHEPHTLLAAPVEQTWAKNDGRQWRFKPGLAAVLAKLTHLPFPNPAAVFADPAEAAAARGIRGYVLYSEGTKSEAADLGEPDDPDGRRRSKSVLHAAQTGFVPGDHLEAHTRLGALLQPLGIRPADPLPRVGKQAPPRIKTRFDPQTRYTLELWTHHDLTRNALLTTMESHLGLTRRQDATEPGTIHYTGDMNLTVELKDGTAMATGITRGDDDNRPDSTIAGVYTSHVKRDLGTAPTTRAAILELGDDRHFQRLKRIDPKKPLKKAFALSGRQLQCLRPAELFVPPKNPREDGKGKRREPYPGTDLKPSTIHRCSAAIGDALRQLGRIGDYQLPAGLPDFEHIGIWLHHDRSNRIPVVVRHHGDSEPTAILANPKNDTTSVIAYKELAHALAKGQGRIKSGPDQKAYIGRFLANVLGVGAARDQHDRIAFVRAESFRSWGWPWMQDKHLTPGQLIPPGVDIDDDADLPPTLSPQDCPGLRIVRVRDRTSSMQVPRAFGTPGNAVRISGLFRLDGRTFYAINPRSDQAQTPLDATKLDPDLHANFLRAATNPVPLELCVAFAQPGDDIDALALLTHQLRRAHAHTDQATRYPGVLHLCSLADEYL